MAQAHALSAQAEVDHALFVRSTEEDQSSFSERRERGGLPKVESEHLPAVRRVLGMGEEQWTWCPLPGHRGSASLGDGDRYEIVDHELRYEAALWCDCLGAELYDGGRATHWYSLADAYFAVQTGMVLRRWFRSRHRLAWRLLLDVDLGLIEPARVELPVVPLGDHARRAAELFRRLYAAQLGAGWPQPGLFAVRLVRDWLGCTQGMAHRAIKELVDANVIVRDGEVDRGFRYRPGGVVVTMADRQLGQNSTSDFLGHLQAV
jgi:hypothetical protein